MSPNDKVTRNGKVLTRRVWDLIDYVARTTGLTLTVIQGGFRYGDGAIASSGTHDKGDVYDISVDNLSRGECLIIVNDIRKWYGDAWLRSPEFGWVSTGPHIHVVQEDSYYELSDGAKQQVAAYHNHRNGLANNGPDPFPQPPRSHFPIKTPPPPVPSVHKEDSMFLASVQYGTNGTSYWLCGSPKGMVNLSSDEATTWTGARIHINDKPTWDRMIGRFGPQA